MLLVTPGVGDYEISKTDLKKRSPVATIGRQKRFKDIPKSQKYV
jgi:hypothetical protein